MVEIELNNDMVIKYKYGQWVLCKKSIYFDKKKNKDINKYKNIASHKILSEIFKIYTEVELENSDISTINEVSNKLKDIDDFLIKMLGGIIIK